MIRPVTQNLFDSMMLDVWPRNAAICDFGLDTQEHYEALSDPIRTGELKIEKLDEILGNGPKITEAVRACPSCRHKDIVFKTAYDDGEDDE